MQDYGCADSQFSTVKVACQGMVVIVLNEPGVHAAAQPPTAAASDAPQPQQGAQEAAAASSGAPAAATAAEPYPPFHLTLAVQKLLADVSNKKRPHTK